MMKWIFWMMAIACCSCALPNKFVAGRKYAPEVLREDYTLFRKILEDSHPGLYWYTPKDSMDFYFEKGYAMLSDSLTETRFRSVLGYVLAKIHCGHTYTRPSKGYVRAAGEGFGFPVNIKFWPDTALVTFNSDRRDTQLRRGSIVTAIDGVPLQRIVDSLFRYLSGDGHNNSHLYQTLSNRGGFASAFIPVFGYRPRYNVSWTDTAGTAHTAPLNLFLPMRDSSRANQPTPPHPARRDRKKLLRGNVRSLNIDSALNTAVMDLGTFTKGFGLRRFFRRSFKTLEQRGISSLVIDLRNNGGGSVTNSNLLTKYLADKPFKIADTLYAVRRNSPYRRYVRQGFWNNLFLVLMTHKRSDGNYHFKYFEGRRFAPKKNHHFNGDVYVLTGGNTFSASTHFAGAIQGQKNVTIVGEETGGGAYGNNAWLIPDVTLPRTGVRFRLPLFRLVIDTAQEKGRGIRPDVFAGPTVEAVRAGRDFKLEKVTELILKKRAGAQ